MTHDLHDRAHFLQKHFASGGSSSTDVVIENNVVYEIEGVTVAVVHADDVSGDVTIEASVEINGKTYEVAPDHRRSSASKTLVWGLTPD